VKRNVPFFEEFSDILSKLAKDCPIARRIHEILTYTYIKMSHSKKTSARYYHKCA